MNGLLVDSNIILDIFLDDPQGADWSEMPAATTPIFQPLR